MKCLGGTLPAFKPSIADRRWYHQSFDGKPMFIFVIADAEMRKEARKPAAAYPTMRVCLFSGGKADWYLDMDDIRRGAGSLVQTAEQDPDVFARFRADWRADEAAFEDFFWNEFPAISIRSLSDAELLRLWVRYYDLAVARFSSTAIIDHFALGTDALVHAMVRKEALAHANGHLTETEISTIFTVVTTPAQQSFASQAETELMQIATGQSTETLEQYRQRYFWIRNNFSSAGILSLSQLEAEIAALKARGDDLSHELAKRLAAPDLVRQQKMQLFTRYNFSRLLRTLLEISEDLCAWQDERKRATYFSIHMGCALLEVIGERRGYTLDHLKWATGYEIEDLFTDSRPSPDELAARSNGCVFVTTPNGYYVGNGDEADRLRSSIAAQPIRRDTDVVTGITASLGSVQGKVRLVKSLLDLDKVGYGDVLVAVMTRPDYLPGMRKAAAIVTNEGGITSHAAIISREFGIPCIIGTRFATELLNDGDLVAVDGNTGTVTVLSKAS
jgi:phosphohistidine swiveling domain-containing protein